MDKRRADQLQFLRLLAFLMIYIWHSMAWEFTLFAPVNGAANAVCFFVILSGFVSGYSSYGRQISFSVKSEGAYLWKKLVKFYPLYIITIFISILYSGLVEAVRWGDTEGAKHMVKVLGRCVLLIQSWFNADYFLFNGVGWFLSTLIFLLILNLPMRAILSKLCGKKGEAIWYVLIAAIVLVIKIAYDYQVRDTNTEFTQYIFPPSRLGEYIGGMAFGYLAGWCGSGSKITTKSAKEDLSGDDYSSSEEGNPGGKSGTTGIIWTILEVAALAFWIGMLYPTFPDWQYRVVHWLAPNIVLMFVFAMGRGYISQIFRVKALVWLGDISFECFLIHAVVLGMYRYVRDWWAEWHMIPNAFFDTRFLTVFCLIVTLLLAAGWHVMIGKLTRKKK